MLGSMQRMAVRNFGMVRGLFVIAGLVVLGGFAMMFGGMIVMFGGLFVMFVDLVAVHRLLPCCRPRCKAAQDGREP